MLACPLTHLPLARASLEEAERQAGSSLIALRGSWDPSTAAAPIGPTPEVFIRSDGAVAFPVVSETPVTLAPEALGPAASRRHYDLADPRYEEAYEEMEFYDAVGREEAREVTASPLHGWVERVVGAPPFPEPPELWLDAQYDAAAQSDAYSHMAPLRDKRVLQVGGRGLHVVKFLLAGAAEGWLVTPMVGEIEFARALAASVGVGERLRCAAAVGEQLPFADASFDRVYAGSCLHHMETEIALPEIARVLGPEGRFGAIDPWRAPLYGIGTRIFGKREPDVHCRPLNRERLAPLASAFSSSSVAQHGALTRYLLLALDKLGLHSRMMTVLRITRVDDAICSVARLRRFGSSVAVTATR